MSIDEKFKHEPRILYESEPFLGYKEIIYHDTDGFHSRREACGTWVAYSKPTDEYDRIIDEQLAMKLLDIYLR